MTIDIYTDVKLMRAKTDFSPKSKILVTRDCASRFDVSRVHLMTNHSRFSQFQSYLTVRLDITIIFC